MQVESERAGEKSRKSWGMPALRLLARGFLMLLVLLATLGLVVFLMTSRTSGPHSKADTALREAQTIKKAAEISRNIDAVPGCPSVENLVTARHLEKGRAVDPFGTPYRIVCDGDEIHVWSSGADHVANTIDDIRDDMKPGDVR